MWNHLFVPAFQILSVCTANICRSPTAETLLRHDLADEIVRGLIDVSSFGTQAVPGLAACDLSTALVRTLLVSPGHESKGLIPTPTPAEVTEPTNQTRTTDRADLSDVADPEPATDQSSNSIPGASTVTTNVPRDAEPDPSEEPPTTLEHTSRRVTEECLQPADLILALDRTHRSTLARISPQSRSKTFTLRQAASFATHVRDTISTGNLPQGAPPIPPASEPNARLLWLVEEMGAARGLVPPPGEKDAPDPWHELDIPDPHVIGYQIHEPVVELIRTETAQISSAIRTVLKM